MKGLRVLHRELVQAEGVPDRAKLLHSRLEQSQPHKAALPAPGGGLLQGHGAFTLPAAVPVVSTINDHLGDPLVRAIRRTSATPAWRNPPTVIKIARGGGQPRRLERLRACHRHIKDDQAGGPSSSMWG